ncbi:putative acrB/acrD/acrF acriflavin resistance family protein [Oceanicaulis sp. HTCC2633]|uniref:efflux RND transporter permease subunit n=1 Tax=Oceanicaulis sp. HTCC2633 TaxID=314254 RepID=UPI000066D627|nr:efflux RND transporter permease subunit [Oceanicaulis sp. HTCC2633]EAP91291.1 putative acrB/acrD/acrF acriflavin resistance family protein [Oceanicaulis sp. HTCC2633]
MTLTDVAVRRPVLAFVASALIIVFGFMGLRDLPLREMPDVDRPVVSVSADYPGANAEVMENRVTQVIEDSLSGIEGVDTISSSSRDGSSRVTITFTLERDIEAAANDVRDAVSRIRDRMPDDVQNLEVSKQDSDARPFLWYMLGSDRMTSEELTDYADRYIVDRFTVLDGVANVRIGGQRRYAMRIWLDPYEMAARSITVADIENALRSENVEAPGGAVETTDTQLFVRVERLFANEEAFARMPIRVSEDGHVIRLGEVADVELAAEEHRAMFRGNGQNMVGLGFVRQSKANSVAVAEQINAAIDRLQPQLPEGMEIIRGSDDTVFIKESIKEVWRTFAVAATLVVLVIYLFLGSFRAAIVPAAVVPVCMVGTFAILAAGGFSINILTLLALVLAIGLVVDDSIVVLENIQRRVDLGEPPMLASERGGRQVFFAVIATTATLVAVFMPLIFLPGLIGRIFAELAVTITGAVVLSSFVALTLSPMMTSKLLKPSTELRGPAKWVNDGLDKVQNSYRQSLKLILGVPWIVAPLILVAVAGSAFMFSKLPGELTPPSDRGSFFGFVQAHQGASFDYMTGQMMQAEEVVNSYLETGELRRVLVVSPGWGGSGYNSGIVIGSMADWDERRPGDEIVNEINARLGQLPGVRAFVSMRSPLGGGGGGDDIQFVLQGPDYDMLNREADRLIADISERNPNLIRARKDYQPTAPRLLVDIDRERAAALGVSVSDISRTLQTHLGSRRVGQFIDRGEAYNVILENRQADRSSQNDLETLFVRAESGDLIPLSSLVNLREVGEAPSRARIDRQRAVTVSATIQGDYTIGQAVEWLDQWAADTLPPEVGTTYVGEVREFLRSNNAIYFAFGLALLIVFLVLAAQFESFIQPAVIMLTVPLAVAGGLFGLYMGGSSLNIFSQIGLIILIGLAAKNGILIVEFANQLREEGLSLAEATLEASVTRLRPILMTGVSTAIGAFPLVIATGPGSETRVTIGLVIFTGVMVATLFTLFVVPAVYGVLGRYTKTPNWVSRQLEKEARDVRGADPVDPPAAPAE